MSTKLFILCVSQTMLEKLLQRMNVNDLKHVRDSYPIGHLLDVIIQEAKDHHTDLWAREVIEQTQELATNGGFLEIHRELLPGAMGMHMEYWAENGRLAGIAFQCLVRVLILEETALS